MTTRRTYRLLALLACLPLLMACSEQVLTDAATPLVDAGDSSQTGYLRLTLGTFDSGDATTRATYEDGDAGDYKVNSATLLLFESDTDVESDMKFFGLYHLDALTSSSTPFNGQVTQQYSQVVELQGIDRTKHYFAYVIVNADGAFVAMGPDSNGRPSYHMRNIKDKPYYKLTSDVTFADFGKECFTNRGGPGDHIMTNAPQATKNGKSDWSDPKIVTVPEVKHIYATPEDAASGTPVYVYVERLAVKITVDVDKATDKVDGKLTETPTVNYNKDNIRWVTDWRATYCYNVRQVPNAATYIGYTSSEHPGVTRFIDSTPMDANADDATDYYRIFWAEDPHYDVLGGLEPGPNVTLVTQNPPIDQMDWATGESGFTMENTMDADHLKQGHTTRVIIRAQFDVPGPGAQNEDVYSGNTITTPHESFFTIQREGQDRIFYDDDTHVTDALTKDNTYSKYVFDYLTSLDKYKEWKAGLHSPLDTYDDHDLVTLIIAKGNGVEQTAYRLLIDTDTWDKTKKSPVTETPEYGTVKLYFTPNANDAAYTSDLTEEEQLQFLYLDLGAETDKLQAETGFYYRGYAYYSVKVRHFSDDEVNDFVHKKGLYDEIYPSTNRAENYLGRYGLVRNHWYSLTVDGIRHIGYPYKPPYDVDTPDDIDEDYLSLRTHIVSWARRGQEEDL